MEEIVIHQIVTEFREVTDIKIFKIEEFSEKISLLFNATSKMLLPLYSKKLWRVVAEQISKNYLLILFLHSVQYKPEEASIISERVKADTKFLNDLFSTNVSKKDLLEVLSGLELFADVLVHPVEKILVDIVKIAMKLKENFSPNCIKAITRLRKDLKQKEKDLIFELIQSEQEKLSKLTKKDIALEFCKLLMKDQKMRRFVKNIKKALGKRKEREEQRKLMEETQCLLAKQAEERMVSYSNSQGIEKEALTMRGYLDVLRKEPMPSIEVVPVAAYEACISKKDAEQYEKKYFQIDDRVVNIKDNHVSKVVTKRLQFNGYFDLGVLSAFNSMYFVSSRLKFLRYTRINFGS